jgi:predicted esterase
VRSSRPYASLLLTTALVVGCTRVEPPRHVQEARAQETFEPHAASAPAAAPAPEARRWPPAPPGERSAFCLEGVVETLAEDACYVLPERPTSTLLVYLPGLMPPDAESPEKRTVETVVANAARRAGVAALVPRGPTRDELAAPSRDEKGLGVYRSWPTSDQAYLRHARRLVERIASQRRALEALVGASFERVFLGGSSAGAYFVAHLALRGEFPADGYAVISGGSSRPAPHLHELPARPLYVGYGDGDVVGAKAEQVAAQARAAGWSVRVSVHHTGHGSREVYLDEAFALFGVRGP